MNQQPKAGFSEKLINFLISDLYPQSVQCIRIHYLMQFIQLKFHSMAFSKQFTVWMPESNVDEEVKTLARYKVAQQLDTLNWQQSGERSYFNYLNAESTWYLAAGVASPTSNFSFTWSERAK